MLGNAVDLDPDQKLHQDAGDYYDGLIEAIFNSTKRPLLTHFFQAQFLLLRSCQMCERLEGSTDTLNYLAVKVLNTKDIVSLESLLWEKCTGHITTEKELKECEKCNSDGQNTPGYHDLMCFFFKNVQ